MAWFSPQALASLEEKYAPLYFLVFLALATLYFYLFTRAILQNIQKINTAVNHVKLGQLDIHIPVKSGDEIGDLAENITEMARTLKHLKEKEAQNEKSKNELIGSLSHDLRTPLTALSGYLGIVQNKLENDPAACRSYLAISQEKCQNLQEQISELLEYSQLDFQDPPLKKEIVLAAALVEQVMLDFVPQMEKEGLDFSITEESPKTFLEVDVALFVRLLQNVISNSLFYGKSGKRIDIHISKIPGWVKIVVANYGEVISQADKPFIFERFYRGEKSRPANSRGKGMGLAIAKRIIEKHAGEIQFTSDPARTEFILLVPDGSLTSKIS
jgi:signal transduction histidine kinase